MQQTVFPLTESFISIDKLNKGYFRVMIVLILKLLLTKRNKIIYVV